MSPPSAALRAPPPSASPLRDVWAAWRSLRVAELRTAGMAGAGAVLFALIERTGDMPGPTPWADLAVPFAALSVYPVLFTLLGLLCWVVPDRRSRGPRRTLHLGVALTLAAVVATVLATALLGALGVVDFCQVADCRLMSPSDAGGPVWMLTVGQAGWLLVCAALLLAIVELRRAGSAADDARAATLRDRARLQHDAYASRMAALQAQVEPQFLFDALVDVGRLYDTDAPRGARTLDALIAFLRTALPRLREPASTVGAEVALVRAWLAVVAARHGGVPTCTTSVAADCQDARAWPMLLLPLVQRGVGRINAPPPPDVAVLVTCEGDDVVARVEVAAAGRCDEDAEVQKVRDRLAALCGTRGRLDCTDGAAAGLTRFTMRWPHEPGRRSTAAVLRDDLAATAT